jgi:hypothetical protein
MPVGVRGSLQHGALGQSPVWPVVKTALARALMPLEKKLSQKLRETCIWASPQVK